MLPTDRFGFLRMSQRFSSPYLRQQRPGIYHVLRHRPFLYAGVFLVTLFFVWNSWPRQYDEHVMPKDTPSEVWNQRAQDVRNAFRHAYVGYERYAAPHDELTPLSNKFQDNFNDSLDTMLLMNLDQEYTRALAQLSETSFLLPETKFAPYAMSKNPLLLARAEELADKLDGVFDGYKGMFPLYGVNTRLVGILAEISSMQLEYLYLSKTTGNKHYFDRANTVMSALAAADLHQTGGMLPTQWNLTSVLPHNSIGSSHEYLLKQYLLTAKTDKKSLEMYIRTTTHIITTLLFVSPVRRLIYVTDTSESTFEHAGRPTHRQDHLSCFLPGLLALGAHTLPLDDLAALGLDLLSLGKGFGWAERGYAALARQPSLKEIHMWAAAGLAQTCYILYADQPTGLAPEEVVFKPANSGRWGLGKDGKWQEGGGRRWIEGVEAWRAASVGSGTWKGPLLPPGVGEDVKPIVYTEAERKLGKGKGRDYSVYQTAYLLRPEVSVTLTRPPSFLTFDRPSSHCILCGASPEMQSGARWAGGYLKPSNERPARPAGTQA
ncbi:glycoside hydrolase family 47 protein [Mycena metata]|uniref:alpha-1,2-Mannosidase n=1 Tax=Mycena metata TaxID=1033252 RepID=A0AAD7P298_9AGAR|nr:glycoside hydrolase family 47 protein [Mycena metata]